MFSLDLKDLCSRRHIGKEILLMFARKEEDEPCNVLVHKGRRCLFARTETACSRSQRKGDVRSFLAVRS